MRPHQLERTKRGAALGEGPHGRRECLRLCECVREEYLRTTGSCERVRGGWSGRIAEALENSGGGPLTQVRLVTKIIITSRATVTILGMMSTLTYRSASWMPRSTRLSAMVVMGLESVFGTLRAI